MTDKHIVARPMPSLADFKQKRLLKTGRSFNDQLEDIVVELYDDKKFQDLMKGVWDEECVEGSVPADNFSAAELIRVLARKKDEESDVAKAKLATIVKALNVVMRRYGESRKERRMTVHGEIVPDINNGHTGGESY
jgi:hypothetical protein